MLLSLLSLAEILEGAQGADRGVEERQEIGNEDVVEEKFPVAMRGVGVAECLDVLAEPLDERTTLDGLGPKRQFRGRRAVGSGSPPRGWERSRGLPGHDEILNKSRHRRK